VTSEQHETYNRRTLFIQGSYAVLPLILAVIPWGILAGSYALDAGLTALESQAMSAIVFAGAAQLVAVGMIKSGIGLSSILLTTLLVTSRHFLYGLSMRPQVSPLPLKWRLSLGFLLTDELFAISNPEQKQPFNPWYALGGGLSFYIGWNISTCVGIIAGHNIPNLHLLGLDFAIVATFIALIVPIIKTKSTLICVLTSLLASVFCALLNIE
jgi:branched chain amino acid efflux pump